MENQDKTDTGPNSTSDETASTPPSRSCALCGCSTPAVRCDRCNSQIFCLSCDDMYHKHPKRRLHLRKAVDSIWSSSRSPRLRRRTDLPGDPSKIPIPPPRTKKRHSVSGRSFLKSGYELGSLGFNRTFDKNNFIKTSSPEMFVGQKSPDGGAIESNYENDAITDSPKKDYVKAAEIYENETNLQQDMSPQSTDAWPSSRPNISSPIAVSIPSSPANAVTNGSPLNFSAQRHPHGAPHSLSSADLRATSPHPPSSHPYHYPHPYPYMHPPLMPPYPNSMTHLHCNQCLSSSWSSLMSPYPSPFFHPVPWGSQHPAMASGPNVNGHLKHSHGDIGTSPEPNLQYPYPERPFNIGGPHGFDPNFARDLHQQAEMQRLKKSPTRSVRSSSMEEVKSPSIDDSKQNEAEASVFRDAPEDQRVEDTNRQSEVRAVEEDAEPVLPEIPTEPWSCLHCTFINPPGIHICQVCCKTSYRIDSLAVEKEMSPLSNRDSESPLINNDAIMQSEDARSNFQEAKKGDVTVEMNFYELT